MEEEKRTSDASSEKLDAARTLCSALARLFSYPDPETAAVFTDAESAAFLVEATSAAHLGSRHLDERERACAEEAKLSPDARADRMRREFSRLFYRPYAPVPLEGHRWIRRDPQDAEAKLGEVAAVARLYRGSGLAVRPEVTERADALPTELDYVAFLLEREARFSREGNGAAALIWKRRRQHFTERHLSPLARAVAAGINEHTDWPPLLYWAALLEVIVAHCAY